MRLAPAPLGYKPHTLIAFGGTIAAVNNGLQPEIWECTIRGVDPHNHEQPVPNEVAVMNRIKPDLLAWYKSAANGMSNNFDLRWLKVNNIDAAGKYINRTRSNVVDYPVDSLGGAQQLWAPILTLCWSWRTDRDRGPGSHGRMYPPNATFGGPGTMFVSSINQASQLAAAQRFLTMISRGSADNGDFLPAVCSRMDATNTPITKVFIGNVWDVQRRRKDAYQELYTVGPAYV